MDSWTNATGGTPLEPAAVLGASFLSIFTTGLNVHIAYLLISSVALTNLRMLATVLEFKISIPFPWHIQWWGKTNKLAFNRIKMWNQDKKLQILLYDHEIETAWGNYLVEIFFWYWKFNTVAINHWTTSPALFNFIYLFILR